MKYSVNRGVTYADVKLIVATVASDKLPRRASTLFRNGSLEHYSCRSGG
jgi:hypothetical protein